MHKKTTTERRIRYIEVVESIVYSMPWNQRTGSENGLIYNVHCKMQCHHQLSRDHHRHPDQSSRLCFFARYLHYIINLYPQLETFFGSTRRNCKGQLMAVIFKQLFQFFVNGTCRYPVYFDSLARDAIPGPKSPTRSLLFISSNAVNRFFSVFRRPRIYLVFLPLLLYDFVE